MNDPNNEISDYLEDFPLYVVAEVLYPISQRPKKNQKPTWCLLVFDVDPGRAAPMIEINGHLREFRVKKAFKNKLEATDYAIKNNVQVIEDEKPTKEEVRYVILHKYKIHCARGAKRCRECKEKLEKSDYSLYKLGDAENPEMAQPTYYIELDGKTEIVYDSNFVRSFAGESEAKKYSKVNKVKIIELITKRKKRKR